MPTSFQPKFVDLVRNYTTTVGTADFKLGTVANGYTGFASACSTGDQFYYSAIGVDKPAEREVGRGTLLSGGTIKRDPIGGAKTDFTSGTKSIALIAAAEWFTSMQAGSTVTVADRAELAACPASTAAHLRERGREGLFVFDGSNLSAKVAADPQQGLYVAIASDPTGASGAWVRTSGIDSWKQARWFGVTSDGTTNDLAAINAAILTLSMLGGGTLQFADGRTTIANGQINLKSNVELAGHGATIQGAGISVYADPAICNFGLHGTSIVGTSGDQAHFLFDLRGSNFRLIDTKWSKNPGTDGYIGYIRDSSAFGDIRGFTCAGANGVYLAGHDHKINGFDMTATSADDCWVVKAATAASYNIVIGNGIARGYSAVVAFGSEIGTAGANDPAYSKYARNIAVSNVVGVNCAALVYIKVGANTLADYRDGTLEDVTVTNGQLIDLAGSKARYLALIQAGRGGRVRSIRFTNCIARYRCPNQSARNAAIMISPVDYPGGTAAALVEEIYFDGVSVIDACSGDPNGGAPGFPIDNAVYVERVIANGGAAPTVGRIEINNLKLNGCGRAAIQIQQNIAGPIKLSGARLRNYANGATAATDKASINALSKVWVNDLEAVPSASAPAGTRGVMGDAQADKTIEIVGQKSSPACFPTVPAGNVSQGIIFTAPADCWIRRVEIVCSAAVTQSDTNYTTITVANRNTTNNIVSVNTKLTGGIAVPAYTPTPLNGATQLSGADAYLPKGACLSWANSNGGGGSGAALTNPTFVVHYVPYGAA